MDINGKALAEKIKLQVKNRVESTYTPSTAPCLACIIVGDDKASQVYVNSKKKTCEFCGLRSVVFNLPENITVKTLTELIERLNNDNNVSGILVQLPLPEKLDKHRDLIINTISPMKDVDCLTNENLGRLFAGAGKIAPCTATGIMRIFEDLNYNLDGKDVTVIGRSLLVGKSVACLLQAKNATVTACHSHTKKLEEKTQNADVVIAAVGKPKMFGGTYFKEGSIIIDVGINRTEAGLVGDVDYESVKDKAAYITPVPGGVGPLTVACLMENTLILHELNLNKQISNNKTR